VVSLLVEDPPVGRARDEKVKALVIEGGKNIATVAQDELLCGVPTNDFRGEATLTELYPLRAQLDTDSFAVGRSRSLEG
jgi:hypothetical protein